MLAALYPVSQQRRRFRVLRREAALHGKIRAYRPSVSVIIPAWNEEVGVIKTLKSVLANKYPFMEIIVVNGVIITTGLYSETPAVTVK